jgi:acetyltransferase-like isoleucine patch superfamily enzyme
METAPTPSAADPAEGSERAFARLLSLLYRRTGREDLRARLRSLILRWERGPAHSLTIRRVFRACHGVEVGLFTAGPCRMKPQVFHRGTSIGRYAAIAETVRTFTRNHPRNTRSTHGVFYNPGLGMARVAPLQFNRLEIGHGVWLGHNVIVLPPTTTIGEGAIVAAGSVVYSNLPPYAIAAGNPASIKGYRFDKAVIASLLASCWWEHTPDELRRNESAWAKLLAGKSQELASPHLSPVS